MAYPANRLLDAAVELCVYYKGVTYGEHAGKLSALLITTDGDVYGLGINSLVTCADYNADYPMQEGRNVFFWGLVKVDKLCGLNIKKIIIGLGYGAAITGEDEVLTWGKGAPTYLNNSGLTILEAVDRGSMGRKVGETILKYNCDGLSEFFQDLPPPEGVKVKRLGNYKYGPLTCSECMEECDLEVLDGFHLNYCANCKKLWDVDENAKPMNFMSSPMGSFLHKLDYPGRIRDIAPGLWGFWILTDTNNLLWSGFFVPSDYFDLPYWFKLPLSVPHRIVSVHCSQTNVFVVTESGALYKRVMSRNSCQGPHALQHIPLEAAVKKLCCGFSTSVCLLTDESIWIFYNELTTPEEIHWNGADEPLESNGCLDVSVIANTDTFYVQTQQHHGYLRMKQPAETIIEIFLGHLGFKLLLWTFFSRLSFPNDEFCESSGEYMLVKIIKQLGSTATVRRSVDQSLSPEPTGDEETMKNEGQGSTAFWSAWESGWIQLASFGFDRLQGFFAHAYQSLLRTSSSSVLPPFQSSIYGKIIFSDLTLRLSDGDFPAHRTVLCSTSMYFREKLAGTPDTKTLDMTIYNPKAYRCLLKHLYQLQPDELDITDMLDLLLLARSYQENGLTKHLEEQLKSRIDANSVAQIMDVCKKSGFASLGNDCEIFMRSDPAYKEMLLSLAIKNLPTLVSKTVVPKDKS